MLAPLAFPRRLHIALVTETWAPEINGVAMTLGRLVRALAARGHHIQVVRPRQPADSGRPGERRATNEMRITEVLRPGVPIPRYQGLRLGLPSRAALVAKWRDQRPDVVHVATEGPLGWTALSAAESLGLPVTSSFHTNFHDYTRHYGFGFLHTAVTAYLRRFHNRTRCTMVPSADLIADLARAGYRNLEPLGRGVDTRLFDPARRDATLRASWGDGPIALIVGRVAPEKDLPLGIRAFRALQRRHPGARLIIVGDGPLRAGLARDNPDVVFTGAVDEASLARHYASADLFLFPSTSETFGNVALEAMASGLAVSAFDYAAPRAYLRHGDNGLLAPFADGEAFIANAVRLGEEPDLIARLGTVARQDALRISWDTVADRFATLLTLAAERQEAAA